MKTLVVYDSVYGNTEIIAQAIGDAIPGAVQVLRVGDVKPGDAESVAMALSVSIGVGFFFGIYPASRAAALNSIEALRCE
jgi:hypothetical protein